MTTRGATLGATMSDVAKLAGVSDMTVSNVFRRPERVSEPTRARVMDAARRLGYVLNEVAGNFSSGRSKTVAAIVPSLSSAYFYPTLQGMMDVLGPRGYQLMLADSGFRDRDEQQAVEAFLRRRPDGFILTGTRHASGTTTMLRSAGIPIVETWESDGPFIDMGIGYSHFDASSALTALLVAKGHRHIGYIDHPVSAVRRHRQRRDGIRSTLERSGLRNDCVVSLPEVTGFSGGRIALSELLARWPEITAVIAATDVYAVGAVFECIRRGLRVPSDLAICGFGNAEIGRELSPSLTTVDTRSYEMGAGAGRMLLGRFEGEERSARLQDVGFELLEREST
jgi:LacI family transcriptional regulator, gluconate utilization system Gnt-I transcriptional repressor